MHQERMLNSSSTSTSSPSSSSSSSSSLISSNHLPKPPISASISSNHHLQHPPPLHPTLLTPFPHYHHLHHLHAYPSVNSTHHLHAYAGVDSSHHLHPLPQASFTTHNINISNSGNVNERLSNLHHTIDPPCPNISNNVINTSDSIGNHNYSVDPKCYTTDCSPRSVIRHVQSSSSAPSPDPRRPSCYSTNSSSFPTTTASNQATNLSIARPHHPTLHETSQGAFLVVHKQSAALDHRHLPPPWSSPTAINHHYYDVCSNFKIPSTHSGHNNYEGGTEELEKRGEMRKSPKLSERGCRSADLHKQREIEQFKSGYFSGSAVEDKPCMIESNDRAGYGSNERRKQAAVALRTERANVNVNVNRCTATKPMYKSAPNSMEICHGHKLHMERSFSCDMHSSKYGTKCPNSCATLSQCVGGMKQAGSAIYKMKELAPQSPDALLDYGDGSANNDSYGNAKGGAQLGSKWEDAEKWVRPTNYQYALGCRGFTNLGLLKMSNCINAGTAIKSHHIHYSNTPAISSSNCTPNYGTDFTTSNCANHSSNRLYSHQESMIDQPSLARKIVHVDCFKPHLTSSNPNLTYGKTFSSYPQVAKDEQIEEQFSKQRASNQQNYQHLQENYTGRARQKQYASSGSMASKVARDNYNVAHCGLDCEEIKASNKEASCVSGWVPSLPQYQCTSHQFTDRFASGEVMSRASTPQVVYATHNDDNLLTMPIMQGSVPMPMVLLREVGTQISSVDGSGSISRFTSKNGSPQKPISPARHNTPAHMRSLNESTSSIYNTREIGKQAIDLEELVKCHRAKLELQALSEGERIHSFHRTTSNWSSRETEEADLSRSLRHSTELDEHNNTKNHPWPSQSYSWNKDEDSKLAKLQLKEARIQAWEDKKKSKADAQLKKLEESLAKKRSQTTNRIMGNLGAVQKKAEEMRASVYAQQKRGTKTAHRFRHRSLSPLSRCICFSPLQ